MSARKLILVLLALLIAGATVQFTRSVLSRKPATPATAQATAPEPVGRRVLVAAHDLPAGTLVQPSALRWRAWPDDGGLDRVYVVEGQRTADEFAGAVVRESLRAGDPITAGRLVKPGERGFLAAVLTPGMRAVSVAITGVTGVGGFTFPGDRVDLILAQKIREQRGQDGVDLDRFASETVLSNVRVLAMDQRTDNQKGEVKIAQIATLEVSPRQAEAVALAVEIGHLSLSLRSLGAPTPLVALPAPVVPPAGHRSAALTDPVIGEPTGRTLAMRALPTALESAAGSAPSAAPSAADPAPGLRHTLTWDTDLSRALNGLRGGPFNQKTGPGEPLTVRVYRGSEAKDVAVPAR